MDLALLGHGSSLLFFFFFFLAYLKSYVSFQSLSKTKILAYWPALLSRAKLWDNYYVETGVTVQQFGLVWRDPAENQ